MNKVSQIKITESSVESDESPRESQQMSPVTQTMSEGKKETQNSVGESREPIDNMKHMSPQKGVTIGCNTNCKGTR